MNDKFIVAIGFSEGGLAPLITFFNSIPHDQATYIILRHLPANSRSQLQYILQLHSKLTIVEAANETIIEKDTVYMPPPSMYMTIKKNKLLLHPRVEQPSPQNQVIDFFLSSLAKSKHKLSIAIILSGDGDDGARGIQLVKAAGGITIVQNLESCEMPGMPKNAMKTGAVDYELMPAEMPHFVLQHTANILKNRNVVQKEMEVGKSSLVKNMPAENKPIE